MKFARRDVFKFAAGAATGTLLTPLPWKLLDDTAIWSQNWSWIPKLPHGEIKTKFSACALCPAGCAVRARTVADQPFAIEAVPGHPVSGGALCPVGIGGHYVAYHPRRIRQPLLRASGGQLGPVAPDTALADIVRAIAQARPGTRIALLDPRPGRTASALYRSFLAQFDGLYLTPPEREEATLHVLASMIGREPGTLGLDLEHTRTLLSFGAPVLDGWGSPGRVFARRGEMRIVQVEPRQSRTAIGADQWIPIRPGTEGILARAIAAALRDQIDPSASAITGVPQEVIVALAKQLKNEGPSVVIGGGDPGAGPFAKSDERAIASLNLLLGNAAVLTRERLPLPASLTKLAPETTLESAPDHSIAVLFIDASAPADPLPWTAVERKLAANALVVSFADRADGLARHAQYILPSPGHYETVQEAITPPCACAASFALGPALLPPAEGSMAPVEILNRVLIAAGKSALDISLDDARKQRAEAIYSLKRGAIFDPAANKLTPIAEIASVDDFQKQLAAGATWIDDIKASTLPAACKPGEPCANIPDPPAPDKKYPLALVAFGWRAATGWLETSPILTKLYQESGLREASTQARVNPEVAESLGLRHGDPVALETNCGSCRRTLAVDAAVMPGVVEVAVGPAPPGPDALADPRQVIDVCNVDSSCAWRSTRVAIRRAS